MAEGGYQSSVTAVGFCPSGGGSCTGECGGSSAFDRGCLPWGISDWGGRGLWLVASVGVVLALVAGAFWGCVLLPPSGLCFFLVVHPWGLCWVSRKQTIPSLNGLSIVFQSPSSVRHC